jgi:hypothetical protein
MSEIDVTATTTTSGWICEVRLRGSDRVYHVSLANADLQRLAPGMTDPEDLVRRSFDFLLLREPPDSILPSFELPLIGRYFPEYEREIRGG